MQDLLQGLLVCPWYSSLSKVAGADPIIGSDRGSGIYEFLEIHVSDGNNLGCDPKFGVGLVAGEFSDGSAFIIGGGYCRRQPVI